MHVRRAWPVAALLAFPLTSIALMALLAVFALYQVIVPQLAG